MATPLTPVLPDGTKCTFVGEGAANVVFSIKLPQSSPQLERLCYEEMLLRVPKNNRNTLPYLEQQAFYENQIQGALGSKFLVFQQLVNIRQSNIREQLNEILEQRDQQPDSRRSDWKGSKVADVEFGMLVKDMSRPEEGVAILQFKPKWLTQSYDAPSDAVRCRSCARNVERHQNGQLEGQKWFCSLSLLTCRSQSGDEKADLVLDGLGKRGLLNEAQESKFKDWLRTTDLFLSLAKKQANFDYGGVVRDTLSDDELDSLATAMTLRDCTCFLRIPSDPSAPVDARLGDLDKKNGVHKKNSWKETEMRLKGNGFYQRPEFPTLQTYCDLRVWKSEIYPLIVESFRP